MKTVSTELATTLQGGRLPIAEGFVITRRDGAVYAFTSRDVSHEMAGLWFDAQTGLDVSDIVTAVGTSVGTLELVTLNDGTTFSMSEVMNGLWRNAEFELFRYNYEDMSQGYLYLISGNFGEPSLREKHLVIELRDVRQYLQQKVGTASSKTCPYRLGSSKCRVDLTSTDHAYTVTGTLTHVTSNRAFRDSTRGEAADWFGEGYIRFTTGNNIGVEFRVRSYAANGTFTLALPVFSNVQIGDEYVAVVGCRHRFEEDCVTKFDNELNFGGQPHRKGFNGVIQIP